ncbi:MAG: hypothetical protein ACOYN3_05935 [Acidimicrobiia bacterium]
MTSASQSSAGRPEPREEQFADHAFGSWRLAPDGQRAESASAKPSLDDLELGLRKLPGVRSVGFVENSDVMMIQVHLDEERASATVPMQAARLAYRLAPGPAAVEVVRWRGARTTHVSPDAMREAAPARVRTDQQARDEEMRWIEPRVLIDRVTLSDDGLDVEVVLSHGSTQVTRTATISDGLVGVAGATIAALREFIGEFGFEPTWAHVVRPNPNAERMVAMGFADPVLGETRTGISAGATPPEAAVRATLHALNRTVAARLPVLVAG